MTPTFIARISIMVWVPKCVSVYPEGTRRNDQERHEWAADHLHRELWQEFPERFEWAQIIGNIRPTEQMQ